MVASLEWTSNSLNYRGGWNEVNNERLSVGKFSPTSWLHSWTTHYVACLFLYACPWEGSIFRFCKSSWCICCCQQLLAETCWRWVDLDTSWSSLMVVNYYSAFECFQLSDKLLQSSFELFELMKECNGKREIRVGLLLQPEMWVGCMNDEKLLLKFYYLYLVVISSRKLESFVLWIV